MEASQNTSRSVKSFQQYIFLLAPPEVSAPEKASAIEGQDMEVILSFTVKSFPPPLSQTYTHNDIHLQSDARITVSMTGELIIRNPSRADAGEYRLTITNSRGTNSAVIILEIFRKIPPPVHISPYQASILSPCSLPPCTSIPRSLLSLGPSPFPPLPRSLPLPSSP